MSRCNSPFHRPLAVLTTTSTAVLALLATACGPRPGDLQTYREVGEFQLTERSGGLQLKAQFKSINDLRAALGQISDPSAQAR